MADKPYPNLAANGVVGQAVRNRASQIDAAESAALNPTPAAAPRPAAKPAAPAAPSVMDRIKGAFGLKSNPENQLPAGNTHEAGARGMDKDDQ